MVNKLVGALIVIMQLPLGRTVLAQDAPASSTPGAAQRPELEEIIVSATRRETNLQEVALAVTVVNRELLEDVGVRNIDDLKNVVPSLNFTAGDSQGGNVTARLRGIGTNGANPGLESSVGVFVDNVYRARNGVAFGDLGELEQIEVLRGPQGTLFGRNTSAGLINVTTAKPDLETFGAGAAIDYGNLDAWRLGAHVTGPIIDDALGFRLFAVRSRRDGYFEVSDAAGRKSDWNDVDLSAVRGQLLWRPAADAEVRVIADYSDRGEICCGAQLYNPTLLNGVATPFPSGPARVIAALGGYGPGGIAALGDGSLDLQGFANRTADQLIKDRGISAEVNWLLNGLRLTSVSAYRDWRFDQGRDADFSAADIYYNLARGPNRSGVGIEELTQELRVAGTLGRLDWLVGAFYSQEDLERRDALINGSQFGPYFGALVRGTAIEPGVLPLASDPALANSAQGDTYAQDGRSVALFTHNIISFFDGKTELTLGARYTRDRKELTADFVTGFNAAADFAAGMAAIAPSLVAYANCNPNETLTGTPADAAIIAMRQIYCLPSVRAELDAAGPLTQTRTEEKMSGVVSLRQKLGDHMSLYGSYARGYKSGGFNLDRNFAGLTYASNTPGPAAGTVTGITFKSDFPAELVDAYEIGAKTQWLDGGLSINPAVFYERFENFQQNTFNGISFVVGSIPKAVTQGVDLDVQWLSTRVRGLSFQGGVAYADTEYGEDTGWVAAGKNPLNPDAPSPLRYQPGNRLAQAPVWTVAGGTTLERPVPLHWFGDGLIGSMHLDWRYTSRAHGSSDSAPVKELPSLFLLGARFGLSSADERYSVELWGHNLLGEDYTQATFNAAAQNGSYAAFPGAPRTFGVTVRVIWQ